MKLVAYNIVAILLIGLAALIVIKGQDGWGWCIFAALIAHGYPKVKITKGKDHE